MTYPVMVYERIIRDLYGLYESSHNSFCILVLELRTDTVLKAVRRLRDDFGFDLLLEVSAAEYPERRPRYEVGYQLFSSRHHKRIRLKVPVVDGNAAVPTLTSLYSPAPCMEREVTKLYGVEFGETGVGPAHEGRLLSPAGATGHGERADRGRLSAGGVQPRPL